MKIGKIISVEYDKFRIRLFHSTRTSTVNIEGKVYYFGNIGSYLKTVNSSGEYILCEVSSIVDWISSENVVNSTYNLDSSREIIIKPIGTIGLDKFCMGIGIYPSLYSDVEIVTYNDLDKILTFTNKNTNLKIHSSINIGTSKSLINYQIDLDINRLFNIHTAVLGNSGSGKSNTIAHLLHEVYRNNDYAALGAKTIIFDVNGEYPKAFSIDNESDQVIDPKLDSTIETIFYKPNIKPETTTNYEPFYLPYYLLNLDEWLSFLMASERTQKPFWDRVLQECYKFYKIFHTKEKKNVERFVNYMKWKLYHMLFNIVSRVESDTSKMTAAKGAIAMIRTINDSFEKTTNESAMEDLSNFLSICNDLCTISYGNNYDSLSNALNNFVAKGEKLNVRIEKTRDGYDTKTETTKKNGSFFQIDEVEALKVNEEKLKSGEYFDYKYLKIAVEITLLEEETRGNLHIRDFTSTLLSRLDYFLYNNECDFMRIESSDYANFKNNSVYLENVLGITANKSKTKQLITIDSSEIGTDTLELMTSVISRMIFDYRKNKEGENRQKQPIHLILDEAHRYIKKDTEYIMRENIFEKIAREGRKYSLFLIISSQRPSELSQTVLSQCGNYIVHKIQNDIDMKYIYSVLPYFSEDYLTKIKQAVPGEALIFGNCVPMPLMVKVKKPVPAPNSSNCDIRSEWFIEKNINIEE